jgi:uncharacterized alkaline shock family protein YloU
MDSRTKAQARRSGKAPSTLIQSRDLGRIEVSRRVVGTIAAHAAAECYGVVGMAAQGLRDGLAERLHRDNIHRGVEVDVREDGIIISLYVIVEFGTRVSEVAHNLTNAVRYAVERTLGLPVLEVNVSVQGIHVSGGN